MRNKTIAWIFFGGSVVASAAFGIAACSSDPVNNVVPGPDGSVKDTGTSDTNNNPPDTSPLDDSGACANPPKLFPPSSKGLYCPYSKDPDGGVTAYCKVGSEVCCLSGVDAGPSTCQADPSACPTNSSPWACSAPEECADAGAPVCCLTAGPVGPDPKCLPYQKTKGFNNSRCTTAQVCTGTVDAGKFVDNQYVVCTKQGDCTTGTCTAVKTVGTSIGLCL